MVHGVAQQVGQHLAQAFAVPRAMEVALTLQLQFALWVAGPHFLQHALGLLGQIGGRGQHDQPPVLARARHVQQVLDHRQHAPACLLGLDRQRLHLLRLQRPLQHGRAGQDGRQRRAQVVPQHRHEHLVDVQRLGALLQLAGQGVLLPVQVEEHARLVDQHVRVDGLVQEVHRTAFVAHELAPLVVRAGGHEDQRNVARALGPADQLGELEAVHLGHLHIQQGQGHIVFAQQ